MSKKRLSFLAQLRESLDKAKEDQAAIYFGLTKLADQVSETHLLTDDEKDQILTPLFSTIGNIFELLKTTP